MARRSVRPWHNQWVAMNVSAKKANECQCFAIIFYHCTMRDVAHAETSRSCNRRSCGTRVLLQLVCSSCFHTRQFSHVRTKEIVYFKLQGARKKGNRSKFQSQPSAVPSHIALLACCISRCSFVFAALGMQLRFHPSHSYQYSERARWSTFCRQWPSTGHSTTGAIPLGVMRKIGRNGPACVVTPGCLYFLHLHIFENIWFIPQNFILSHPKFLVERTNLNHESEALTPICMLPFLVCLDVIFLGSGLYPRLASHPWMCAVHVGQTRVKCWAVRNNGKRHFCSAWARSWLARSTVYGLTYVRPWSMLSDGTYFKFSHSTFPYITILSQKPFEVSGYKQSAY